MQKKLTPIEKAYLRVKGRGAIVNPGTTKPPANVKPKN